MAQAEVNLSFILVLPFDPTTGDQEILDSMICDAIRKMKSVVQPKYGTFAIDNTSFDEGRSCGGEVHLPQAKVKMSFVLLLDYDPKTVDQRILDSMIRDAMSKVNSVVTTQYAFIYEDVLIPEVEP